MNKKLENILLGIAISFSIAYALGAFYSASFNISEWSEHVRFSILLSGVLFSGVYAVWINENNI